MPPSAETCRARILATALVIEITGGLGAAFSLYSETLKRALNLTQGQLQLVASANNVGNAVGLHIGLMYDAYGPRVTAALAFVLGVGGWGGMWLVITAGASPLWLLFLLAAMQGHGILVGDCAAIPTVVYHFPAEQLATALGLTKAMIGLSASLAAQAYAGAFAPPPGESVAPEDTDHAIRAFMGALTVAIGVVTAAGTLGLTRDGPSADSSARDAAPQEPPDRARNDGWMAKSYGQMLLLIAVLVGGAAVGEHVRATRAADPTLRQLPTEAITAGVALVALLGLLARVALGPPAASADPEPEPSRLSTALLGLGSGGAPMAGGGGAPREPPVVALPVPISVSSVSILDFMIDADQSEDGEDATGAASVIAEEGQAPPPGGGAAAAAAGGGGNSGHGGGGHGGHGPPGARDLTLLEALASPDFWLHFGVQFAVVGSAYALINNLAQVVRALGPPPLPLDLRADTALPGMSAASLVSLISACNCLGRLGTAQAVEGLARRGVPRTAPFVVACLTMGAAHLLVAAHSRSALAPACALCGLAYGALNALNPIVVSALYGNRAYAAIYTAILVASALGSLLVATALAVHVYEAHTPPGEIVCVGSGCFRTTSLVCASLSAAGAVLATALSLRLMRAKDKELRARRRSLAAPRRGSRAAGATNRQSSYDANRLSLASAASRGLSSGGSDLGGSFSGQQAAGADDDAAGGAEAGAYRRSIRRPSLDEQLEEFDVKQQL